jgi:phosphate/sulfate permease
MLLIDITPWMAVGFILAAYSVIANDSIQTLGTFIAANKERFPWYKLWIAASTVTVATIVYGWYFYGGDIAYERLTLVPFQEIKWYHAMAPGVLLILTRFGIPVSTTFLVLSTFASTVVLEKILVKSMMGYGIAALSAYLIWVLLERWIDEKGTKPTPEHVRYWRVAQWVTSGVLLFVWLQHDLANIAVFLPRQLTVGHLLMVLVVCVGLLGHIFYIQGGRIQKVVLNKTGTRYVRSATFINIVYICILFFFKELNNLPMSTTWVFVGLLAGRELAISTIMENYKFKYVFPIVAKDFSKMMLGLGVSVAIVLIIHNIIVPAGF